MYHCFHFTDTPKRRQENV